MDHGRLLKVIALDVGTRNLGVALVNSENHRVPLQWMRVDLLHNRRNKHASIEDIVKLTVHWVRNHAAWFNDVDSIVLEKQMRTPFIVMNSVISALHLEKVVIVHPQTVGRFWNLPTTRAAKKEAAIACVAQNGALIPKDAHGKYDDMADAYLMAVYQLVQLKAAIKVEKYSAEFQYFFLSQGVRKKKMSGKVDIDLVNDEPQEPADHVLTPDAPRKKRMHPDTVLAEDSQKEERRPRTYEELFHKYKEEQKQNTQLEKWYQDRITHLHTVVAHEASLRKQAVADADLLRAQLADIKAVLRRISQ